MPTHCQLGDVPLPFRHAFKAWLDHDHAKGPHISQRHPAELASDCARIRRADQLKNDAAPALDLPRRFALDYGRFVVETLKPLIDAKYRTLSDPANIAAMDSSLGGVVSFYLGWQCGRKSSARSPAS